MDSTPPGDRTNRTLTLTVCVLIAALAFVYVFISFRGLDSANAMDQAQIARELARGHGFRRNAPGKGPCIEKARCSEAVREHNVCPRIIRGSRQQWG